MDMFTKIANYIQQETGYKITYNSDTPSKLDGETRNETRGVLKVLNAIRGYDNDVQTKSYNMIIEFIVAEEEETEFLKKLQTFESENHGLTIELNDDSSDTNCYRMYFDDTLGSGIPQIYQGKRYLNYVVSFKVFTYDNVYMSDDLQVKIGSTSADIKEDDLILKGIIQFNPQGSWQRDSKLLNGSNIPQGIGCSKIRTYSLTFFPTKNNLPCTTLLSYLNTLKEDTLRLRVKFPATDPIIDIDTTVSVSACGISLQKGTFGQVSVTFNEYSSTK